MKRLVGYVVATIQTHLDWIKERERTGLTTWAVAVIMASFWLILRVFGG